LVKTLHLLRHAKSDRSDRSLADHDRPLARRGKRTCHLLARHVAGWPVDLVVCSTAVRATATAEPVIDALGCPVRYEEALYAARARDLLEVVTALAASVDTAMLVGHNPSLEELTATLSGWSPHYPTAALGTLELAVDDWADVGPGCGTLTSHVTPAELGAGH
jgi:phosphohistidine phosphatase